MPIQAKNIYIQKGWKSYKKWATSARPSPGNRDSREAGFPL